MTTATKIRGPQDLAAAEDAQRREALARYDELLARLDREQAVPDAEALATLKGAGKTASDLAADLAKIRRGRELRAIVACEAEAREQHRELTAAIAAKAEERKAVDKRLAEELAELHQQQSAVGSRLQRIDAARRELRSLAPTPEGLDDARQQLLALEAEIARLQSITRGKRNVAEHAAELAALEPRIDSLRAERNATPLLHIVARGRLTQQLAAAVRRRQELQADVERYSGFVTAFAQLGRLLERRAELQRTIQELSASREP